MSELKPCPFCGESKLLYSGGCGFRYDDDDNQIRLFRVHCRTCKGRTGLFESLDEAVEAWNRRTNSTTIQPSALGTNLAEVGTKIEPLTDKEQRIFLAAMGRERKVCKEVDDQYTHEPYEVMLTKVCSEIERKVKAALWS